MYTPETVARVRALQQKANVEPLDEAELAELVALIRQERLTAAAQPKAPRAPKAKSRKLTAKEAKAIMDTPLMDTLPLPLEAPDANS